MLDKLVKGEKVGGTFARVKIDPELEKESCVMRLGDLNPSEFIQKRSVFSKPEKGIGRKAQIKKEMERSARLDAKLRNVIKDAKKKLAVSPSAKKAFYKIVED